MTFSKLARAIIGVHLLVRLITRLGFTTVIYLRFTNNLTAVLSASRAYPMRFKVFSFRGFLSATSVEDAEACANSMLCDIVKSFANKTTWWVLIFDTQTNLFKLGSCPDLGCISYTPWLFYSSLASIYK